MRPCRMINRFFCKFLDVFLILENIENLALWILNFEFQIFHPIWRKFVVQSNIGQWTIYVQSTPVGKSRFWAADPKGMISYGTGGIFVRLSVLYKCPYASTSVRLSVSLSVSLVYRPHANQLLFFKFVSACWFSFEAEIKKWKKKQRRQLIKMFIRWKTIEWWTESKSKRDQSFLQ